MAVVWLSASWATPIHGVIPYYKELKKEREQEEFMALLRDCNNPASTNPKCADLYESGFLYTAAAVSAITGRANLIAIITAFVLSAIL